MEQNKLLNTIRIKNNINNKQKPPKTHISFLYKTIYINMAFISKCFLILSLIGVLNGVLFFLLKENDTIRQTFFASLCASMARTSSPEMKKIRCDLLKNENIKGKVIVFVED